MTRDVLIIGSGMAGLTAYQMLNKSGLNCLMLEKARGVGGRMSHRRHELGGYDHGTSSFKVSSPIFEKFLKNFVRKEIMELHDGWATPKPAGNALAKALSPGADDFLAEAQVVAVKMINDLVQLTDAQGGVHDGKRLLVTCPMPQAEGLLGDFWDPHWPDADMVTYRPVVTMMLTLERPQDAQEIARLMGAGDAKIIWESDKPGRPDGHRLVVHFDEAATLPFLQTDLKEIARHMSGILEDAGVGLLNIQAHRWLYAHTKSAMAGEMLAHQSLPIWVAGDGFGLDGVETAFLSAHAAALDIIEGSDPHPDGKG